MVHSLTQTLVESFNALADEVQTLSDRQTVLEHKLRFAHEQFQYLADKYAPAAPEIAETLVKLQLPSEIRQSNTNFVPLPRRNQSDSKHQIALIIREGRRVASTLSNQSRSSRSSRDSMTHPTMTSLSTVMEQDFTVEGKKGTLGCPFSQPIPEEAGQEEVEEDTDSPDNTPHQSSDPICAAMLEETTSQPAASANGGTSKCPIRYLDQHSPDEIAHYVETHKHELPRSHEVCIRRYQRNEDDIKKLDAKYGNLANMVEGLSRIHQPMLPDQDTRPQSDVERGSNERVENWAQAVSVTPSGDPEQAAREGELDEDEGGDRQSHFDRPLKEVRVGESPSRPWGISVPIFDTPSRDGEGHERPPSPPPAPVLMPSSPTHLATPAKKPGKCPFDHTKLGLIGSTPMMPKSEGKNSTTLAQADTPLPFTPATPAPKGSQPAPPATTTKTKTTVDQPAFISTAEVARSKTNGAPQMLFTGPVFIGYPIEQAIQFMQHFQEQK